MMNANTKKNKVKGFTIVEMIVVVAIIIVLLGVLAPSMMTYYRNSRIKAANADAKMVYNAAQTEIMHYMSKDRKTSDYANSSHFGVRAGAADSGKVWICYDPTSGGKYKINGGSYAAANGTGDSADAVAASKAAQEVITKVNRMVSGASDVCWSIYVENYIVEASVSANTGTSNCIGYYSANKQQADKYSTGTYNASFNSMLSDFSAKYNETPQKATQASGDSTAGGNN
jgi:type II secretory pathway pseudopilin PulG